MASDVTLGDLRSMLVNHYFTLISISLAVYDYTLTFVVEVERFWMGGPLNWASGFFYLNRYLLLVGHIPIMIQYFWVTSNPSKIEMSVSLGISWMTKQTCRKLQSYHQYLAIAIQLIVASMLIMRMYALYERRRRVLGLYIGVSLAVAGIGLWAVLGAKDTKAKDLDLPIGCTAALTHDLGIRLGAAWTGMLVFDTLVFGMTLYKSLALARSSPEIDLLTVLLRDGTVYFAVMMASNLGNILTFVFGGPLTRGVVTTFTNVISSVMISRLMLNLRDPSLLRQTSKSGPVLTDDITYPNLTFVDPVYSTTGGTVSTSDDGSVPVYGYGHGMGRSRGYSGVGARSYPGIESQIRSVPGRARNVYDYLARGSSQNAARLKDPTGEILPLSERP